MAFFQLLALGVFYTLFIGRSVYLHRRGERVFVIGRGKRGARALLEVVFMAGLLVWSGEIVARGLGSDVSLFPAVLREPLFDSRVADVLGGGAIIGGLLVFAAALHVFGRSWRIGIDHDRPGQLITQGIFRFTRNPIFLFMDLYFTGTWLIQRDLFFLLFAIVTVGGIHYQILQEEKFLLKHYGESYRRYMRSVPRYIGGPWQGKTDQSNSPREDMV
jgi:protein-S-isoprenylcysteine O-methyltransferase Ste14